MKTKILVLCIAAMAATAIVLLGSMQQSADQLYQSAIYKEDVEGQLEEAIAIYQQIIEKFPNDAPIAAKAWFHIGLCYEKLGNREAQKAYQQVLNNYADQKEVAAQARSRLTALAKATKAVAPSPKFRRIEIPGKPPMRSAAMLSPDGTRFAFLAKGDIWTVPVSGGVHPNIAGEPVRLTENMNAWEAGNCTITWSTDGQWIAFRAKPNDSVYLAPASGGEPRCVVDGIEAGIPGGAQMARISVFQGGDKIVFPGKSSGLFTIQGEGGRAAQLVPGMAYEPAFSPNGKLVAYIKGEQKNGDKFESIMVVPADGGEPVLVSSMPGSGHLTDSPTWSPDGRMIAFPVGGKENSELWIVPVSTDGRPEAEPTKLDLKPIAEAKLRGKSVFKFMDPLGGWSRKNEIAFLLEKPNDSAIYKVPASGGRATLIGLDGREPRWSPDGKRVYFRGKTNIESVAAEGGDERSIPIDYKSGLAVWFPAGSNEVSRDGKNIVFAGGFRSTEKLPGEDGIYVVPSQGGEARPIVIGGSPANPSWSPDGRRIAYTGYASAGPDVRAGIWIVSSEGGSPKQITSDVDQVSGNELRWSPDGKTIAYFGDDRTVRLIPSTGGPSRVLTQIPIVNYFLGLSWSPDGSKLVYTTMQKVWIIPASGGEPQEVPVGFDGSRIMQIDWSPDGRTLAFTGVSGAEEEVWLMSDFIHLVKTGESQMARQSVREDEPLGFTTRRVWEGAHGVFGHAPSPDGRHITYTDWESGNLAVRDLKADTSRLLTNEGTWEEPSQVAHTSKWSPDGKQIAYQWHKGSEAQLRILSLDDPQPRMLFRDNSEGVWIETLDWSPDGRNILAQIDDQLVLIPLQGGSNKVIKTSVNGGLFSPDGRYIAYGRTPGKVAAFDIFIMDANGSGETPLVRHPADDRLFDWSPDGKWILFLSDRSGTLDFWVIRTENGKPQGAPLRVKRSVGRVTGLGFAGDGSYYYADVKVARDIYSAKIDFQTGNFLEPPQKAITRFEGSNMNPRYSPDSKWLAYTSRRGSMVFPTNSANALCIQSLESGTERVFMDEFVKLGVRSVMGPRWAPDSRSLIVAGPVGDVGRGLYQVNLDTGEVSPVVEASLGIGILNHEFSTDSRHLYYVREDSNRKLRQILKRDLSTGEELEIYRASSDDEEPRGIALSPDGKRLAILSYDQRILSVMPSSGGTPRVVHRSDQSGNTYPEWARDGRYVLIGSVRGKRISLIPMDGGQIHEIDLQKSFSDRITAHPDGQQIAFTIQFNADSDADVWVMRNFLPK